MKTVQTPEVERKIILQIDGSISHRCELERAISRVRPGTIVQSIDDGAHALKHLVLCGTRYPLPHLVLLSKGLPGMDGYQLLRQLRGLPHLMQVPVIMVHGDQDATDVARAHEMGASAFLRKPVEKGDYPEFARQIVNWRPGCKESWSEVGPSPSGIASARQGRELECEHKPVLAMGATSAPSFPGSDSSILGERFFEALGWFTRKAEESLDPLQLAISRACRRHSITEVQAKGRGGSHGLIANRRGVLLDLIRERFPDETLLGVFPVSKSELKRLRAVVRAKVGPELGLRVD